MSRPSIDERREKEIHALVERCKNKASEKGIYIIQDSDYVLLSQNDIKRVVALIESDGKYKCNYQHGTIIFETVINPNYETNRSVIETNASVRKTNDLQKATLIITTLLVSINTFFQIMSWSISKENLKLEKEKLLRDTIRNYHNHNRYNLSKNESSLNL